MTSEWNHFALGEITELVIDYRGKTPKNLAVIGANKDIELYPRKTSKPDASFRLKLSDILTNRCIESG